MPARERRYILRSLFTPGSAKFWKLKTNEARLIFVAMVVNADDNGEVECDYGSICALMPRWDRSINPRTTPNQPPINPRTTPGELSVKVVSSAIQGLVKVKLIETFARDGKRIARVVGFAESQKDKAFTFDSPSISSSPSPVSGSVSNSKTSPTYVRTSVSTLVSEDLDSKVLNSANPEGAFKEAQRIFRRVCRKSLGSLGPRDSEWSGLVARYGPDLVVQAVEVWAREKTDWLKECKYSPIGNFLKNSSEWIEAAKIENEPKDVEVAPQADKPNPVSELMADEMVWVVRAKTGQVQKVHRDLAARWLDAGHITKIFDAEPTVQ